MCAEQLTALPRESGRRTRGVMGIAEGEVYLYEDKALRRIVGFKDGYVFYSKGGDRVFSCQVGTLKRWIRERNAQLATTEPVTLELA